MAALDVYRSLSEEQKSRLKACSTPAQLRAFIQAENIAITPDQLEAFAGNLGLGKKIRPEGTIDTGFNGKFFVPSEEWQELVLEARENERAMRQRFPSDKETDEAAIKLIAGDPELPGPEDKEAFVEACLSMRGPFREGKLRRAVREKARLIRYLDGNIMHVSSREDYFKLWETAMESEPRWRDDLPAHFRTPEERIPFSHKWGRLEPGPVPAGSETTPPDKIPEALDSLTEWLRREDIQPELKAVAAFLIFEKIHPFNDGNGHTGRLLSSGILASCYSELTLVSWLRIHHENKRIVKEAEILTELTLGEICTPCCMILRLLTRAQRRILG